MRNVGLFIDCVDQFYNINYVFKGNKLSYAKYMEKVIEISKGEIFRAFAYGVQLEDEATSFIAALESIGYEPKYRQAKIFDNRPDIRRTNWYVGMFADVVRLLERIDVAVIGSSDSELIPMLDYIKERGVKTIVLSCNIPNDIYYHSDACIEITKDMLE